MMLAGIKDYFFLWQVPMFVAFAAAWLIGGVYLTRRVLARATDLPRRQRSWSKCAQINAFATGMGLVALVAVVGLFTLLYTRSEPRKLALLVAGVLLGPVAMLATAWAVTQALIVVPVRSSLRITLTVSGAALGLLAVVACGAFIPGWFARQAKLGRERCQRNLQQIHFALEGYAERYLGKQAPTLQALVDAGLMKEEILHCPARADGSGGYLYRPCPGQHAEAQAAAPAGGAVAVQEISRKIRVCDRRGNHGGVRNVLFTDGHVEELKEDAFQRLLEFEDPRTGERVNAAVAKLVRSER